MRCSVAVCPWAALAFVFLLCDSSTLSMAICVHQMHQLRSVSTAVRSCKPGFKPAPFSDYGRAQVLRRKGVRRGRASSALHSDAQERVTSPASHLQPLQLLTAMDRALPFGRCVGVALPSALTKDTLRAAEEELMPEEVSYCLALPPTLQVGTLISSIRHGTVLRCYELEQCTLGNVFERKGRSLKGRGAHCCIPGMYIRWLEC